MAKIPNGVLGGFIGNAGTVSGYIRMGQSLMRSKRVKSKKPMTQKRIEQQQKIKVCNEFTKPFSGAGFFSKTFPAYGATSTGYNRATSALLKQAVTGIYPDVYLSYPQVLIAQGQLLSPANAVASLNEGGNIAFTWSDNTGFGTAKANDQAILVAYFPSLKEVMYVFSDSKRSDGSAVLDTHLFTNCIAETWMSFISHDENDAANSVYTGQLVL